MSIHMVSKEFQREVVFCNAVPSCYKIDKVHPNKFERCILMTLLPYMRIYDMARQILAGSNLVIKLTNGCRSIIFYNI